jgi:UDP-N-acetylmuramoyl-L-alanyl-D-glutamate--2,6-diaminopimelate ligase
LSDRPLPDLDVPVCVVKDVRTAYGNLCQSLAGNPSRRLKLVGITGTNGKTTTTYLTASVLDAAGYMTGILGTLGCFDGLDFEPSTLTTPAPPALAKWLGRMDVNGCSHAVLEVSSHALAQQRIAGIGFDVAAVTNIQHDHLDYHKTHQDYADAKARLFKHLRPEGVAIVNADDPGSRRCLSATDGPALSVGIDSPAELSARIIESLPSEQTFLLSSGNESVPVRTALIGRHNVLNGLMATAVGITYGIELETIVRGLEAVKRIPGRLERIECGQPFSVYVDYAHTEDALTNALAALRPLTKGRLICVFGAGGNRDRLKRPRMARAVERFADLALVTSDNPRFEDPQAIINDVLAGFASRNKADVELDRAQAIRKALEAAQPGDAVLIAGKGHEAYQIVGHQRFSSDDRELAKQWLYDSTSMDERRDAA